MNISLINGEIKIAGFTIPKVPDKLENRDILGAIMVRWGINRDNYRVDPGLYAIGNPGPESDVFVTANYKLSFDNLRKNLPGINGWILVLDTKGINVWCAAGKGTFGTKELVNRIRLVSLDKIVNHKRLIVPQLGATGVAAHKVKEETGFNVQYGPVRASDIKKYLTNGYRADKKMRRVTFGFRDRLKLIPNDFIYGKFYFLGAIAVMLLISGIGSNGFSFKEVREEGWQTFLSVFSGYVSGTVITPMLLPNIPGRFFSLKGFFTGAVVFVILLLFKSTGENLLEQASWFLIITAISSYMAMNFTGSSTFTSLSGVKKEMKISLPLQVGIAALGTILQIVNKLTH